MVASDIERDAYREVFWESLQDCPVLRMQLIELVSASSWRELGDMWGYDPPQHVRDYVRGPLRRRLEREAGAGAVEFLMRCCGERAL